MNETFLLYLFTRLDPIITGCVVTAMVSGFLAVLAAIFAVMEGGRYGDSAMAAKASRGWKTMAAVAAVAWSVAIVVPSKSDMALIVGGKMALDAVRSPEGQALKGELYDAVMHQLRQAAGKDK